jgi:hypothetical protein
MSATNTHGVSDVNQQQKNQSCYGGTGQSRCGRTSAHSSAHFIASWPRSHVTSWEQPKHPLHMNSGNGHTALQSWTALLGQLEIRCLVTSRPPESHKSCNSQALRTLQASSQSSHDAGRCEASTQRNNTQSPTRSDPCTRPSFKAQHKPIITHDLHYSLMRSHLCTRPACPAAAFFTDGCLRSANSLHLLQNLRLIARYKAGITQELRGSEPGQHEYQYSIMVHKKAASREREPQRTKGAPAATPWM